MNAVITAYKNEVELWQILRMHANDIEIKFDLTPHYGDIFYIAKLYVCDQRVLTTSGRHLYKRFDKMIKKLNDMYGENLYKHGAKPLKQA